jgi:hypothetical protein
MSVDGLKYDSYTVNFNKSGRRGTLHAQRADLESEAGGFSVTTASVTDVTVYTVPSQKTFHLKTLIVQNLKGNTATLQLFASDGGGKQRLAITLPSVTPLALGQADLQGIIFGFSYSTGAVYARIVSASTEVSIFAGGQVRDQDNT